MITRFSRGSMFSLWICLACGLAGQPAVAWQTAGNNSFQVNEALDTLELITGSSRRLTFDYKVPEVIVENPEIVNASPVSATQVTITGRKPGVSTISFKDLNGNLQTITVNVKLDVRKVEMAIAQHFRDSAVRVSALSTGIVLSGYVAKAEDVDVIVQVAHDFFPTNIINLMQVEGSQVVAIEVKVYEVSRTKLRSLGIDWAVLGSRLDVVSGFGDLIQNFTTGASTSADQNFRLGVINDNSTFNLVINALEKKNVAKLLSQPTLIAQNGRPAEFLSGGEIPIQVSTGLGTNSIEFRPFGTKLDFVPLVHGEGNLTLEVRAEVSEVANDLSSNTGVPGFRVRRVNTGVPMRAGQTLALAGDYNEKTDGEAQGAPGLVNKPIWGAPFRKNRETRTETELVFLITPRFVNSVDCSVTHLTMPGQNTESPSTQQLFSHSYIEVPRCAQDCPSDVAPPFAMPNPNEQGVNPGPQHQAPAAANGQDPQSNLPPTSSRRNFSNPTPANANPSSPASYNPNSGGFGYPNQGGGNW